MEEKEKNSFSFDLLSLMECQNSTLEVPEKDSTNKNNSNKNSNSKNSNKKSKKNNRRNNKRDGILCDSFNKRKRKNIGEHLISSSGKKKNKKVIELNTNDTEYESSRNYSPKNEGLIIRSEDNSIQSEEVKTNKRLCSCILQTVETLSPISTEQNDKDLLRKEKGKEESEWNCCGHYEELSNDMTKEENNDSIEKTVVGINQCDDMLFTYYREYYRDCPSCKLYLKELTKRMSVDFLTVNEYITQSKRDLVLLKNKEIEELKKKNEELEFEVNFLKEKNIFLMDKVETVTKSITDIKLEFQKIIEDNRMLKELNNNLSQKICLKKRWKQDQEQNHERDYEQEEIFFECSSQKEKNQRKEIVTYLENERERDGTVEEKKKEEEEEDSIDKEIFNDMF